MKSLLLLAALAGCTEYQIHAASFAVSAVIACDVGQTLHASDDGRWDRRGVGDTIRLERDPLLGNRPPPINLAIAGTASVIATEVIAYSKLPRWMRISFLAAVAVIETAIVAHHEYSDGFCGLGGGVDLLANARAR